MVCYSDSNEESNLSAMDWYSSAERLDGCGVGKVGRLSPSLILLAKGFSTRSVGGGGGATGVEAFFFDEF